MSDEDRQDFLDHAAELYDDMVVWNHEHLTTSLGGLETTLRHKRLEMMSLLLKRLLDERARRLPSPTCPRCGRSMIQEGRRTRWVESLEGRVRIERPYFTCRPCGQRGCSLDLHLGLRRVPWSEGIAKGALSLAAIIPCEQAAGLFQDLTGISISRSALHRLSQGKSHPLAAARNVGGEHGDAF